MSSWRRQRGTSHSGGASWTCPGAGGGRYMMYWRRGWPVHVYRPVAAYDPFSEHPFSGCPRQWGCWTPWRARRWCSSSARRASTPIATARVSTPRSWRTSSERPERLPAARSESQAWTGARVLSILRLVGRKEFITCPPRPPVFQCSIHGGQTFTQIHGSRCNKSTIHSGQTSNNFHDSRMAYVQHIHVSRQADIQQTHGSRWTDIQSYDAW